MTSLHPILTETTATIAVRTLQDFTVDLQHALTGCFPTNIKPYKRVLTVFLHWENLEQNRPELSEQIQDLKRLFTERYKYTSQDVKLKLGINSNDRRNNVVQVLLGFMRWHCNSDDLIIFYYGGHAVLQESTRHTWIGSGPPNNTDTLDLTALLLTTFEHYKGDVIYLLNACYAPPTALGTGKELLAASATQLSEVSTTSSFTTQLHNILSKTFHSPITLAHLHAKLCQGARTHPPIHSELHRHQNGSLVIAPMHPYGKQPSTSNPLLGSDETKVLISVHLANAPNLASWRQWLSTQRPAYIRDVDISIISAHQRSHSTFLVIIMIPAAVHNAMHGHEAYQMIGYVSGSCSL
ncbi:MAG: hypothetical protein Q9213_003143 [Squamulea squamosa]